MFVQDLIQAAHQRHVYPDGLGLLLDQFQGVDPFGHLPELRDRVVQFLAFSDCKANTVVTALGGGTCHYQVANACKPHKRHRVGAQAHCKPAHLGKTPGDQHGLGVLPHLQSGGKASDNGIDILESSGQLNAVHIHIGVYTEVLAAQEILNRATDIRILRCDHGGGQVPVNDFTRQVGSAEYTDATARNLLLENLAHQFKAVLFNALGQADNNLVVAEFVGVLANNSPEGLAGDGDKYNFGLADSIRKVGGGLNITGEFDAGHVPAVDPGAADFLGLGFATHPEMDAVTVFTKHLGHGGTETAAAQNRYITHRSGCLIFPRRRLFRHNSSVLSDRV